MPEEEFNGLPFEKQVFWLLEAVYVCGQSFAHRKFLESEAGVLDRARNWFAVKLWHWRRRRSDPNWSAELADFRIYLNTSRLTTDYKNRREGYPFMPVGQVADSKGRALGAPYDAMLIQFLIRKMGKTEAEAMEYPLALAEAHYFTALERDGGIRVLNSFETQFEEKCIELEKTMPKEELAPKPKEGKNG